MAPLRQGKRALRRNASLKVYRWKPRNIAKLVNQGLQNWKSIALNAATVKTFSKAEIFRPESNYPTDRKLSATSIVKYNNRAFLKESMKLSGYHLYLWNVQFCKWSQNSEALGTNQRDPHEITVIWCYINDIGRRKSDEGSNNTTQNSPINDVNKMPSAFIAAICLISYHVSKFWYSSAGVAGGQLLIKVNLSKKGRWLH